MNKLPTLSNWEVTGQNLHRAARLLGALRLLLLEPRSNHLELALEVRPTGVSSGLLPFGGEVVLDFAAATMVYQQNDMISATIPLAGHSPQTLFEAVLMALAEAGHDIAPITADHPTHTAAFRNALIAGGHTVGHSAHFDDETPLQVNAVKGGEYAQALYHIFTAMARFRARLNGSLTPLVIWPGHFDLSTIWFATDEASESASHLNFGFAPFSPGFERPYLYTYAYPYPPNFAPTNLPSLANWNTTPWTGVVVPYDALVETADPEATIEATLLTIYEALLPAIC